MLLPFVVKRCHKLLTFLVFASAIYFAWKTWRAAARLGLAETTWLQSASRDADWNVFGLPPSAQQWNSAPPPQALTPPRERRNRCAINLYGLPRSFAPIVLPALRRNVIEPNAKHCCDYFVHYYQVTEEKAGRSGNGGTINPEAIRLLRQAVHDVHNATGSGDVLPKVEFRFDTDDAFWNQYQPLIDRIRNTKDDEGRYLYFPWHSKDYIYPTATDNIIKMWHSVQAAWNLMKAHEIVPYTRVAMLRSDVVFMTPIDVYMVNGKTDARNTKAIIPAFGRHPVSDRFICGPAAAVEIWANQRFARMENHVQLMLKVKPGFGMHSERFMYHTIFPAIREKGVQIVEDNKMCFVRARADETVWIDDCENPRRVIAAKSIVARMGDKMSRLEQALGRACTTSAEKIHNMWVQDVANCSSTK